MVISSLGGTILNRTIVKFPKVASYQPVINGVAGNLVGVQASRLSTALHQQKKNDETSKSDDIGRLLIGLVVPGHLIFNLILSLLHSGMLKQFVNEVKCPRRDRKSKKHSQRSSKGSNEIMCLSNVGFFSKVENIGKYIQTNFNGSI